MPNDMMIAALQKQRSGKVDMPTQPAPQVPEKPQGIEERISALEQKYDELCEKLGMDDKTPKDAPRGY